MTDTMTALTLRSMLDALRQAKDWREAKQHAETLEAQIRKSRPTEPARSKTYVWAFRALAGKLPANGDGADP